MSGGVLRLSNATALPGGIAATGGTSALTINGGVVELANGNFLRDVGTGSAQFQITGGYSGFSASGAARIVTVNNSSAQELVWGTATFAPTTLVLNETTANNTLNLTNKLDLNGATRTIAVNANTATVSGVIRDATAGTAGLTKIGTGTLVLNQTNTYTGPTTISGGTLSVSATGNLGDAAAILVFNGGTLQITAGLTNFSGIGHTVVFNANQTVGLDITGTFTADQAINVGVGGLTKAGAGTLVLNQANTFLGTTTISAGTLRIDDGGSLANSKLIVNNGTLSFNRTAGSMTQGTDFSIITGTGAVNNAAAGTLVLNNVNTYSGTTTASAGTITVSHALAIQNSALVTTGAGTVTLSGVTTPTFGGLSGATGNLGSANVLGAGYSSVTALTLNPNSGSVTYGGVISDGTVGMTLTKTGAGTQILSGANTYTGLTTVTLGTLTVGNGTTGSLNGTTGTALTFNGAGTFNVAEAASSTQGMGALTFGAGGGTVTSTGIAAQNSTLTFASLTARAAGTSGNFTLATNTTAAQNKIVLTSTTNAPLNASGSNNQGFFFGGTEYARYDTTAGYFRAVTYGTDNNASPIVAAGLTLGIDDATKDVKISGNITTQATASVNTLNVVANTVTLSSTAQVLSTNGVLATGGAIATTGFNQTGNILTASGFIQPAVAGGELVINVNSGTFVLNPTIQNNTSASSLTKTGTGTLTLNAILSTYSGGTVIAAGTLGFASAAGANTETALGLSTGLVTLNPGATLALNRNYISNNLALNGGTITCGNSFASTLAGTTITLTGNTTINVTGNLNITGNMTGTGGITKTGGTVVPVTGTNTYTGPTIINGGALKFKTPASLYNNTPASWIPANITVGSGGSFMVNVGGRVSSLERKPASS